MLGNLVPLARGAHESFPQQRNVLVVPGVPVGNRGAVRHAVDFVAVIPPCHHAAVDIMSTM